MIRKAIPDLPSNDYYGNEDRHKLGTNKNSAKREFNRLLLSTPKNRRYQILIEVTFEDKNKKQKPKRFGRTFGSGVDGVNKIQKPYCPSNATEPGEKPDFDKLYNQAMDRGFDMVRAGDEWDNAISGEAVNNTRGSRWAVSTIHAVYLIIWRTLKRPKKGRLTVTGAVAVGRFKKSKDKSESGGSFIQSIKPKPLVLRYRVEKKVSKKEQAALEKKYAAPKSRANAFKRLQKKNIAMQTRAFKRKNSK